MEVDLDSQLSLSQAPPSPAEVKDTSESLGDLCQVAPGRAQTVTELGFQRGSFQEHDQATSTDYTPKVQTRQASEPY